MNKVYIVGLPASGKTTAGQWLANKMGWTFVDLDNVIEQKANSSVADIFDLKGEGHFRILESEALRETENLENAVISTGGGTASYEDNMEWMNGMGLTIYLNTNHEIITERLILENGERPMFTDLKGAEIADYLRELHDLRKKMYGKSKLVYNKSDLTNNLYVAVNQLIEVHSEA